MKTSIFGFLTLLIIDVTAQKFDPHKKYHADSLKNWTRNVMNELSLKHPGFYRYTPKEGFDYLIDSTAQSIDDSLTVLDYYRKLKPLLAQIGCLHTSVTLSPAYDDYLEKTSALFPFELFITDDHKFFIVKNHSSREEIPIKSQLLSINNRPVEEILAVLLKAIPSDGKNETLKLLTLNHHFSMWFQKFIDASGTFKIEVLVNGKIVAVDVNGVRKEVFPTMESLESANKQQLKFKIENNVGILTVHSFAKTVIKRNGQNFKRFVKLTFKEINAKQIKNLVVDLRYNTGGTDGNAVELASYFFDTPFRYWDRIEVTEALANEIKGLLRLFYKKPIKKEGSHQWRKIWITREFDYYEQQKPAKNNYRGQTYVLTNGLCISSCGDFTAVLAHNNKAIVVGQETGGGFQGNTSGMMPKVKIRPDLYITVPLQKYTNAVDLTKNFGRGTIPHRQLTPTLDNWITKKDVEMEFVLKHINSKK